MASYFSPVRDMYASASRIDKDIKEIKSSTKSKRKLSPTNKDNVRSSLSRTTSSQ